MMRADTTVEPEAAVRSRLGRPRDASRDDDILDATIDILAECGYDGMTIDAVATRVGAGKATVYRRWPSKADLVLDAVTCLKAGHAQTALPDTGTLRGDLLAMVKPVPLKDAERKLRVMAGVASMMSREPELAEAAFRAILEPRVIANRTLLQRAVERGEIRADADVERLAVLVPSMTAYRALVEHKPMDRDYVISLIDGILLPAVGIHPSPASP
ncbi:MAG: TetR/AcrR family transcriptional regulator [Microbacterium sp.]|uniref:TetR/AcrR family transcriptional regulator n=1 Tax=Microbacterium sp. TaxID=51671 RepID=UPI0039E63122